MDVLREPGQNLSREIAKGEAAEKELDNFITRRDEKRRKSEPERELEELWKESERHEAARRREENRAGWYGWHRHRAALYARLSEEHGAKAEDLMEATDEQRRTA